MHELWLGFFTDLIVLYLYFCVSRRLLIYLTTKKSRPKNSVDRRPNNNNNNTHARARTKGKKMKHLHTHTQKQEKKNPYMFSDILFCAGVVISFTK